jgi:predicted patatin/cPLA2 family phospholipase
LVLLLAVLARIELSSVSTNKISRDKEKFAIVVGGGGMKCAYSAGVLAALAKELKFTDPYVAVGSSGGISLTYYISGQYNLIEKIWTDYLTSKKFISLTRLYPIMDINYMVDVVFKQLAPLDTDKIMKSKIRLFLSATNYNTGKAEYFSNDGKNDIFEEMRATTAVPLIFNQKVTLNGNKYVDGDIASSINMDIQKAVEEGANKILVINNNRSIPAQNSNFSPFWKFYSYIAPEPIRNALNNNFKNDNSNYISKTVEIFNIEPSSPLTISAIDNNPTDLKESFKLGYDDVVSNSKLKEFLK